MTTRAFIDVAAHILPEPYLTKLREVDNTSPRWEEVNATPMLFDLNFRRDLISEFDAAQVLTLALPGLENLPMSVAYMEVLAFEANESMMKLISLYPNDFVGAIGSVPLMNITSALKIAKHAVETLGCKGIQLLIPQRIITLDGRYLWPLYEYMQSCDLPVFIHPARELSTGDQRSIVEAEYNLFLVLGWPFDSSIAASRLVLAGVLAQYPRLKIVLHHAGGMIPYFAGRIEELYRRYETTLKKGFTQNLTHPLITYFKQFYVDTALYGNWLALNLASEFFLDDHLLFGTDLPYDDDHGYTHTRNTIKAVRAAMCSDEEVDKVARLNAVKLLHLEDR